MKVAVLGNGGFGTALAIATRRMGHGVALWGHDVAYTATIAATRRNPRYLPGVEVQDDVLVTTDPGKVLAGADVVLVAVPTQHVRGAVVPMRDLLPRDAPLVSLAKGLEQTSSLRPSQVLADVAPGRPILAMSGPSHAEEVARGMPALVVLAGSTHELRRDLQRALSDQHLRVYRNDDLLGVELCGALKNVIAVAAGIAEGLGLGDNARAAILARGLAEMVRYGQAEGARPETFYGLAGVGDLAATAFSPHGRNRALGERIGRGEPLQSILASTQKVAEGVFTARVVQRRAGELRIEMPLCDAVCRVLFEGLAPAIAVRELMERDRKREVD